MAKFCTKCGNKLSLLSGLVGSLCKDCSKQIKAEESTEIDKPQKTQEIKLLEEIKQEILREKTINNRQIEILRNQEKQNLINLYSDLFVEFESDGELDKSELETLQELEESLSLTHEEVDFEQRVLPYHYVYMIKNEGKLPKVNLRYEEGFSKPILKAKEEIHFWMPAILNEVKTISMGYQGGSNGISIRAMKGVSFRVGACRGHVKRVQKSVTTSIGYLMITNKRIMLNPLPGNKPVSIPLNKVLSYNCFENGVEIYKEGREKGYFFGTNKSSAPEIIGMCLGFLCESL
jgi:hypothetical protein